MTIIENDDGGCGSNNDIDNDRFKSYEMPVISYCTNCKYSLKFPSSYKKCYTFISELPCHLTPVPMSNFILSPDLAQFNKLFKMAIRRPIRRTKWGKHILKTMFHVVKSRIGSLFRCYVILSNRSRVAPNAQLTSTSSIFFLSYKRGTQKISIKKVPEIHVSQRYTKLGLGCKRWG